MALQVDFLTTPLGIPAPGAYVRCEWTQKDMVRKTLKGGVSFYFSKDKRDNDVRDKQIDIERQLEARRAEQVALQLEVDALMKAEAPHEEIEAKIAHLDEVSAIAKSLVEQLRDAEGDLPFYQTIFEFPITGQETVNDVQLFYELLRKVNFTGRDNGKAVAVDFTKAVDV